MKRKGHILLCLSLAAVFVISAAGTTLAAWTAVDTSDHVINTAGVSGRIVEEYEGAEEIYPGSTTEKVVNVENTGAADSVIRIKVEKAWGSERDEDGNLVVDETISTDNILINYNTAYWQYDEEDGYFYYKGVLAPGETTAEPLFESFTIDEASTGAEYAGLTADIRVIMECVQAAFEGSSIWGKTLTDLGITYTAAEKEQMVTEAEFQDPETGFVFTPTDETTYTVSVQDLFYNFKNLLPGETVSQTITVTNSYTESMEIFLRAEEIEQSLAQGQEELVERLLKEYAVILVTDEDGQVVYYGPIWGNLDSAGSNPVTMTNDVSLGTFAPGETKTLNVQVQIDPEMGNEYQDLWGLIRWVWTAQGDEGTTTETPVDTPSTDTPKTGDNTDLLLYASACMASGAGLILALILGRKKQREEETV